MSTWASPSPDHPAAFAARKGRVLLAAGQRELAISWLDRAARLAPEDVFVRLSLASAMAAAGDGHARRLFGEMVRCGGPREAFLGLAILDFRQGKLLEASKTLGTMLQHFAPPEGPAMMKAAEQISEACGLPGWVSSNADGEVTVHLRQGVTAKPTGRINGTDIPFVSVKPSSAGRWSSRLSESQFHGLLSVEAAGLPLLGSPLDVSVLRRLEGVVQALDGGLKGWIRYPADPDKIPYIDITPAGSSPTASFTLATTGLDQDSSAPIVTGGQRWAFQMARQDIPWLGPLHVTCPGGRALFGSPIDPTLDERTALRAAYQLRDVTLAHPGCGHEADYTRPLPAMAPMPQRTPSIVSHAPGIDVIIPVYRGAAEFRACLDSVLLADTGAVRIIIVDDGSPDQELRAEVAAAQKYVGVEVLSHSRNLGFPAAINTGLRGSAGRDVVLLNSDTLVPHGWLERLRAVAYSASDIGSVTPFTNNGSIASYPDPGGNEAPDGLDGLTALDQAAWAANGAGSVELPTGVGFCMYIRYDCLAEVGHLRDDVFAQGYGEENDWCLRARRLGWRHALATGVFVAHLEGRSFGPAKTHLMRRNADILEGLHPGYGTLVRQFHARDPLAPARRAIDIERWRQAKSAAGAIILITHRRGGGVERFVSERAQALRVVGLRPIIMRPSSNTKLAACVLSDGTGANYANLCFALPDEKESLLELLREEGVRRVEIHHLLDHGPEISSLADELGVPFHIAVHDYACLCPRISLLGRNGRYCGEPDLPSCSTCAEDWEEGGDQSDVAGLRVNSRKLFQRAQLITAPSLDVADRLTRHLGTLSSLRVTPWESLQGTDSPLKERHLDMGQDAVLAVVGAIGREKGYDVLLACARDAERRGLPLSFLVVGRTMDDNRLLRTGRVFVTGPYQEGEAEDLLKRHAPAAGFVPSVVPETWCFALTELLKARLPVAAFHLGAQAERLEAVRGSLLLPITDTAPAINAALLEWLGFPTRSSDDANETAIIA
ncbi:glycosyltransferase [Sediminicoccus sp. BL-A-41-H5]|uniref:glycosyltransferase n=1 Tax=Sediminicoccus sp. BL-A-41-H5 TaxID=3421106 RepID=UPI003D66BF6F